MKTFSLVILTILFFSSCDPAAWQALADEIDKSQNQTQTTSYTTTYSTYPDCNRIRLRKSYIIEASKYVDGTKIVKRYQAWTENYGMYLVEINAYGQTIKKYEAGGESLPDGLKFKFESKVEADYVYGADNRLVLENKVKIVPLFEYCNPWKATLN